jgi:hypothetical protein
MFVITHNTLARRVPFLVPISSFVQPSYRELIRKVRRRLQNAPRGTFFWPDTLEGGVYSED